jgi:hypothetical protein
MIDGETATLAPRPGPTPVQTKHRTSPRPAVSSTSDGQWRDLSLLAARCRAQVGQTFTGPHEPAVLHLLQRCLSPRLSVASIHGEGVTLHHQRPQPGDLVLFDNTADQNQNQKADDLFTEAGVVVQVDGGRVKFVFLRGGRACLGILSLRQPHRRRLRGLEIENSYLRIIHADDPPRTRYLAGQLLAGFATPTL